MPVRQPGGRGRVLLVGDPADLESLGVSLEGGGYDVYQGTHGAAVQKAAETQPDAIVLTSTSHLRVSDTVHSLRTDARTARLPLLVRAPEALLGAVALSGLRVDDVMTAERTHLELEHRLQSLMRGKWAVEREEESRARLAALLDISRAAASTLDLPEVLRIVVRKLSETLRSNRCAVLLAEKSGEVVIAATMEAPEMGQVRVDLSRYPELALALSSRETVIIEDARTDPRMAPVRRMMDTLDVRSILVQPLLRGDEVLGALFLRQVGQGEPFDEDDRALAQAVASAVTDHLYNAQLHADLKRKRDELEAAYVDRYRELAAANRRHKEANTFKDELIATLSHDLRAPLNVLLGHGQLLLEENPRGQTKDSLEAMVRQGRKILELVESLLERGKGEAARLSIEPSEIDLSHHVMESCRELEILGRKRAITVRAEAPQELWTIADRIKIRQVLQNVIHNAVTHARTRVTVHAERVRREGGDQARISVVDDGPGLPLAELPVVFDRYRHGATGVGLGLSIVREFVELHGGEIWAENLEEGGAAFRMLLPLKLDLSAAPAPEKPRVLLVEDEAEALRAGTEILRTRYRVEVARDGAEAVAKARQLKPDLVLMDVFLPRVDGLDAAAALRAAPDTAHIPILMISAAPEVASKIRSLHLGVTDMVSKPFEPRVLLERVEQALHRAEAGSALSGDVPLDGMDAETGMLDRAGLLRRAEQEELRAQRHGRPLAIIAVVARHPLSLENLGAAARLIRSRSRGADVIGHWGAGTFIALLPECSGEGAKALAQRLIEPLSSALGEFDARGVAVVPPPPGAAEEPIAASIARLILGRR